jgi:flavin-binding protein dodecin
MADPFRDRCPPKRGPLASLGAARRKRVFLEELEAELARAPRICDVEPARVRELAQAGGVELDRDLTTARRSLYRRFLECCLTDYALSEDESEDLAHLQKVLALDDVEARGVYEEVVRSLYGQALDRVLEDYHLDPDEEAFLRRLGTQLELPDRSAAELDQAAKARARDRFLKRAVVHGSALVMDQKTEVQLEGSSATGLEDAVRAAIAGAGEVLPELRSAALSDLRIEVRDGAIVNWSVRLLAEL